MNYVEGVPESKLNEYNAPILYASKGNNIWHRPKVVDGKAVFVCETGADSYRIGELATFQRRRNTRVCKRCREETELLQKAGETA